MTATRKLVTVRRISKIKPIRGTHCVIATVDGWKVVVQSQDRFKEGDLVVYIEIDSILPTKSVYFWDYDTKSNVHSKDGGEGYLVRTIMVAKHVSQGLIFRFRTFTEINDIFSNLENRYGYDNALIILMRMSFEKELGIEKYEEPQNTDKGLAGPAPVFFPQPGCARAQNATNLFKKQGESYYQITEKLDGIPMTIYCIDHHSEWDSSLPLLPDNLKIKGSKRIGISSRQHDQLELAESLFWTTAKNQGMLGKTKAVSKTIKNVAIQGELCGSSIYTNSMGFKPGDHHFYAFDIYDIDRQEYLTPHRSEGICKSHRIDYAPVIHSRMKLSTFAKDIDDLIKKAEGTGLLGMPREGLVFKEVNGRFSFKAISNPWLLQTGKGQ